MEEIKVGEFIRTNKGVINKILSEGLQKGFYVGKNNLMICIKEVVKHSPNIIDLIEEGDYVNGYKVSFISEDYAKFVQCDYPVEAGTTNHYKFYKESIKDVVTKEQFDQMKYIVGDE